VELHLLTFGQRAEALGLDGRVVAEDVLAATILGDETEALRIVEPLHGTGRHASRFAVSPRQEAPRVVSIQGCGGRQKFCAGRRQRSSVLVQAAYNASRRRPKDPRIPRDAVRRIRRRRATLTSSLTPRSWTGGRPGGTVRPRGAGAPGPRCTP